MFNLKIGVVATATLFLISSCERNETTDENLQRNTTTRNEGACSQSSINYRALYSKHHTISIGEAAELADGATKKLLDENELRNGRNRELYNVQIITKEKSELRSSEHFAMPDTLAYVFNYADSAGFAMVCADDRVPCPVLACVENGALNLSEDVENPGLAIFLECAQNYMENAIEQFEIQKDSLEELAKNEIKEQPKESLRKVYTGSYEIVLDDTIVGPLLGTAWGQQDPYNKEVPLCSSNTSKHCKVGCWAVAVGQTIAFHKHPKDIDGVIYPYTSIRKKKHLSSNDNYLYKIPPLLSSIGKHIDMNYGCDDSGADVNDVVNWLRKVGYEVVSSKYSWDVVKRQLNLKHPVLMHGKRNKVKFLGITWGYTKGHAWVLDGYKRTKTQHETYRVDTGKGTYEITSSTTNYINNYLHINWGWDGENNGYFAEGCFDVQAFINLDEGSRHYYEWNYKYEKEIILLAK